MSSKQACQSRGRIIRPFVILAISLAALALIFYLKHIFIPLGIALLIAYIVEPVLKWLDNHHTKRRYTVIAVYVILFGTLFAAGFSFGPILTAQVKDFVQYVQEKSEEYNIFWDMFIGTGKAGSAGPVKADSPEGQDRVIRQEEAAVHTDPNTESSSVEKTPGTDGTVADQEQPIGQLVKGHARTITGSVSSGFMRIGRAVLSSVRSIAGYLGQTVLVLFYAFFFMMHFRDIRQAFLQWIPAAHEQETLDVLREIDKATSSFFRGRLLICVISTVVTAAGLFISGIPYWLLLGLTAGFLGIIPLFGVMIALIPAVVMALISDQILFQTIGVLLTFGAVQGVVEPFVGSLIISKEVQLHPVTVITAFLIGSALFGILGVLLAVPIAGIIKILSKRYLLPRIRKATEPEESRTELSFDQELRC